MAFTFTISNLVVARAADNIRRHSRTDHSHHEAIINGHEATGLEDYEPPLAAVRAAEQAEHESELQESHSVDPAIPLSVIPLTPPNPKPSKRVGVIAKELMHEIYMDDDPMSHPPGIKPDWSYGHTNFQTGVFNALLDMYVPKLRFYLEVGSFKAGSIVLAANELKRRGQHDVSLVCIDPFTGDVNMWAWNKKDPNIHQTWKDSDPAGGVWIGVDGHDYLKMRDALPTIYPTFRANVLDKGHDDMVLPIQASSIVGMRLIRRLKNEGRISELPQMIYLDSAHEEHETFLELQLAWDILQPGGILLGDDYVWSSVRNDVNKFAKMMGLPAEDPKPWEEKGLRQLNPPGFEEAPPHPAVIVMNGHQWYLRKPPNSPDGWNVQLCFNNGA